MSLEAGRRREREGRALWAVTPRGGGTGGRGGASLSCHSEKGRYRWERRGLAAQSRLEVVEGPSRTPRREICPFVFSSFPSLKVRNPIFLTLSNIRTSLILVVTHFRVVKNPNPIYYLT